MHFPLCPPILFIQPNSRETFPAATHHHAHIHSGASCADTRVEYGFSFPLFFAELTLLHHPPHLGINERTMLTHVIARTPHTQTWKPWKTNPPINRLLQNAITCFTAQLWYDDTFLHPPVTLCHAALCPLCFFDHTNSHYTHSNTHDSGVVVACHLVAAAAAKLFLPDCLTQTHTYDRRNAQG